MAGKKQKSKARLDKYYKIAKEQGYRSRAAFKLIQLNKKFGFLQKALVLVDLCAAPGGWLQVATKFMLPQSLIIGLDLDKIKHIPGTRTFQEDITTQKCVDLLKKEIGGHQADVFLNDGAPNVGCNWSKDSHVQCELALSALKLASQFLRRGGWFVTKVFRSNDFNSLKWVLNKFFGRVEVTKPMASRNTSAQIFVVCGDYLAPEYIDEKLFDPAFVFQDTEADMQSIQAQSGINSLKTLLTKKRNRSGYQDDLPQTMSRTATLTEFVECDNPFEFVYRYAKVEPTSDQEHKFYGICQPPADMKESLSDLRVLGGAEITRLIKWRAKVRSRLAQRSTVKTQHVQQMDSDQQLDMKILAAHKTQQRDQRKKRQRAARRDIRQKRLTNQLQNEDQQMNQLLKTMREQDSDQQYIDVSSDEEQVQKPKPKPVTNLDNQQLEEALDQLHTRKKILQQQQKERRLSKIGEPEARPNKKAEAERLLPQLQGLKRSRAYQGNQGFQQIEAEDALVQFQNPLRKKRIKTTDKKQDDQGSEDSEDKFVLDLPQTQMQKRKKKLARQARKKEREEQKGQDIEVVPQRTIEDYTIESLAETLAIAKKMLRKRQREDIITQSYLNPMPQDQNLPDWFKEDQLKHCYKRLPITKEQYQSEMERLQAINSKASRKVLEADFRKRRKAALKMKKASQKAQAVMGQEGLTESWKLREANRVFKRAISEKKKEKKYIVGQKGKTLNKGSKLTKFVDARLKKDKRGVDRIKRIKKRRHVHRHKGK